MGRDINILHPMLKKKIAELTKRCLEEGLKIGISETWRSVEEQNRLYEQGRTRPGKIVTNAKGSSYSSMHQWYIAFDFYRNDGRGAYDDSDAFFTKVGSLGRALGLEWGGDWSDPVDKPHFQLPDWGSTPSRLKRLYGTPEKFREEWSEKTVREEDGDMEKRYNTVDEIPDWGKKTIQKLVDKGCFADPDRLDISEDMLRVFVIIGRAE